MTRSKSRRQPLPTACIHFDRIRALSDGRVEIAGYEFRLPRTYSMDLQRQFLAQGKYSLVEVGVGFFADYLDSGNTAYVALPIPVVRSFRHETFYVAENGPIRTPEQLASARIGVPDMAGSSAIWQKAILAQQYNLDLKSIQWVVGKIDESSTSWLPPSEHMTQMFDIRIARTDTTLSRMLLAGELDAILAYRRPEAFKTGSGIVRLFPDYIRRDTSYFRSTGVFPILHLMAARRSDLERDPELAVRLISAFTAAKNIAIEEAKESLYPFATVPFLDRAVELAETVIGTDFWPYGYDGCRVAMNAFLRDCFAQGVTRRLMSFGDFLPDLRMGEVS